MNPQNHHYCENSWRQVINKAYIHSHKNHNNTLLEARPSDMCIFQKSFYIDYMLHKIICNKGLYISKILSAFRICTISKEAGITNKVYKPL